MGSQIDRQVEEFLFMPRVGIFATKPARIQP
jgi:hypothetical protein